MKFINYIKKTIPLKSKLFLETELIELALAVYLGSVMEAFLRSIVSGIIIPIIQNFLPIDILHAKFKILNINFGDVFQHTISMIIALFLATVIINFKFVFTKNK